ncbi:MAG: hypothetical protein Q7Q71_07340 [Verrucomicrobiota bacterium JB023]|nr:hypothetical protein [Verrucomicrobiota bacterium JB023]
MKRLCVISFVLFSVLGQAQAQQQSMRAVLEDVYSKWRQAMMTKNARAWQATTSTRRQVEVRNRIHSEKLAFPGAIFNTPVPPPDLRGLTLAQLKVKGPTAKAVYFGKIDFGVGGAPTDNLLVVSYVMERGWTYDNAEFINLIALPEVRKSLAAGDYSVVDKPEFQPTGGVPRPSPIQLKGPVKYIAKVYCYCPGREVTVQVNRRSRHVFGNTKSAETVIGGAHDGENVVEYKITDLPGSAGNEPIAVRVYLMSEVRGVKIPAVFEYQVNEGGTVKTSGQGSFVIDAAMARRVLGR